MVFLLWVKPRVMNGFSVGVPVGALGFLCGSCVGTCVVCFVVSDVGGFGRRVPICKVGFCLFIIFCGCVVGAMVVGGRGG